MHNTPPLIHRTATRETWAALIASNRDAHPRLAQALELGASFESDGVRLYPPLGYEPKQQLLYVEGKVKARK